MTPERQLINNLRRVMPTSLAVTQGIVIDVDGLTCTVEIGDATISGIRLRASLTQRDRQIVMIPKMGSAVTLASLSGDLNEMVIIQVDEVDKVIINGGQLGGMINIGMLTDKINELVEVFNRHTHTLSPGAVSIGQLANAVPVNVPAITKKAQKLNRDDYEDKNITH